MRITTEFDRVAAGVVRGFVVRPLSLVSLAAKWYLLFVRMPSFNEEEHKMLVQI